MSSIELDDIVHAYTSDSLVCAGIFSKKVLKLLDLRWQRASELARLAYRFQIELSSNKARSSDKTPGKHFFEMIFLKWSNERLRNSELASDLKSDLVMMTPQRRPHVKLMGNPAVHNICSC